MSTSVGSGVWSSSEHERFLEAILLYPRGPWTHITEYVGTRSVRQVQTHARKYQHKLKRHERGLIKRKKRSSRVEHRVDKETATYLARRFIEWPAYRYRHAPFGQERYGSSSSDEDGSPSSDEERIITNSGCTVEALQCLLSETRPATSPRNCTRENLDGILCQSPLGAVMSSSYNFEPLPFEASQELDEHGLRESLKFLELYGLLDDDRDVNLVELGQCLPGSKRFGPIQTAPCRAAIKAQDDACSLSL